MHSASLDLVLFNMRIAIVIPTCNDSLYVAECLKSISAGAKGYVQSVIVVDAGSKDGTLSVVRSTGLHQNINGTIIEDCSGGRGAQCALGAKRIFEDATGKPIPNHGKADVLMFVDADTLLPANYGQHVYEALKDNKWGAWESWSTRTDVETDALDVTTGVVSHISRIKTRGLGITYAHQCLFVRREAYEEAGGFPNVPQLEDLAISGALKAMHGLPILIPSSTSVVHTAMRRVRSLGSAYTYMLNKAFTLHEGKDMGSLIAAEAASGSSSPEKSAAEAHGDALAANVTVMELRSTLKVKEDRIKKLERRCAALEAEKLELEHLLLELHGDERFREALETTRGLIAQKVGAPAVESTPSSTAPSSEIGDRVENQWSIETGH